MKNKPLLGIAIVATILGLVGIVVSLERRTPEFDSLAEGEIALPAPVLESNISIEEGLSRRRSVRQFSNQPLTLAEISQILWAAQGITDANGHRTAPSAGALYPLEVYLLVGDVENLAQGIYQYIPSRHGLRLTALGDQRMALYYAALSQEAVKEAAIVIVIAGIYERTTVKYGDRGKQYVYIEVGSVAQNVYLQAVSLNLGTVFIGAFGDEEVKEVLKLQTNEHPLGLMPIGRKK